ncbi:MAG: DNA-binding response regulator [Firmicutes bacterium HGW-Firmicutes-1]|jgi:two-component system LytT family response regulator|nr:MAG: DNA-binding response regulator [Firmicutes bacterium HGW-Firmicutes-1]
MGVILIVEDEVNIRDGLIKIVSGIDNSLTIHATGYAEEALSIANLEKIDVFFLDIQLTDYTGIELAKQIREIDVYKLTPIVFITGVHNKELEAYRKIHCYSFINKPFNDVDIRNVFQEIQNGLKIQEDLKIIKFREKEFTYILNQEDIIYIEHKNRKLFIKTIYEEATFSYYSLTKLIDRLNNDFMRCHKSYIVNTTYIRKIDRINNYLNVQKDEKMIPIGRKFKEDIWRVTI